LLKPKDSIYTRQYAAAFVTRCTLSLDDGEGSWVGLCQCDSFVMFCGPNVRIMTEVSEKFYTPKNQGIENSPSIVICLVSQLFLIGVTETSNSNLPNSNVPVWSVMSITSAGILGCVLVAGIAHIGLYRYRQLVRSNIGNVQSNSFVHGNSTVVPMSICSSYAGELPDGNSVGVAIVNLRVRYR